MKFYNDFELAELIRNKSLVTNCDYSGDVYAKDSPIQPASLDLHVGIVLVPGVQEGVPAGEVVEHPHYSIPSGGTVVVLTKEELQLDSETAGIVFPASGVGFSGIVITNPGHLDPGYKGKLRFTVVNVGKHPYPLCGKTAFATALFFKITKCTQNWTERGNIARARGLGDIRPLSRDFLDVDIRAETKAQQVVTKDLSRWNTWATIAGVVSAALITGGLTWFSTHLSNKWREEIQPLKAEVESMKVQAVFSTITNRLDILEKRLIGTNHQDDTSTTEPRAIGNADTNSSKAP